MNRLQLWHLKKFCKDNELDVQLIDKGLTYGENKQFLESLLMQEVEQLAEEYAKTYEQIEGALTIAEKLGVDLEQHEATESEVHLIKVKAILTYRFRRVKTREQSQIKATRTIKQMVQSYVDGCQKCPFQGGCKHRLRITVKRKVIIYFGITSGLLRLENLLESHRIPFRLVKLKRREKGYQYLGGFGWVRTE